MRIKRERVVCAALVCKVYDRFGLKVFSLPGGPILDYDKSNHKDILSAFTSKLSLFLKKHGGMAVFVSPNLPYDKKMSVSLSEMGYKELGEYIQVKWISTLDLRDFANDEKMLASFKRAHRQNIRKACNRYDVGVEELSLSEIPIFYELAKKAANKHSFSMQPMAYFEEMHKSFGKKVKFLVAYYKNKPLAGAMFILYGDEIVYAYSGSDPEYGKYYGSFALQWYMLKFALENNFKRYNFYGVKPFSGNGVYEFKLGFRAETEELMGTYALPLNPVGKLYVARLKYRRYGDTV